jgi:hypothetical protein
VLQTRVPADFLELNQKALQQGLDLGAAARP